VTVCTKQPPQGFIGEFLIGEFTIGDVEYLDASTGVPLSGQAITGMWWAYPCGGALQLGGLAPDIIVFGVVPSGALELHAPPPGLDISDALQVPDSAFWLVGQAPTLAISSTVASSAAALGLAGQALTFAGQSWLDPFVCIDLFPVAAPVTSIDLEPEVCR
jgi:hypothetical protein